MLHDDLTFLDPVRYALGSGAKKDILKRLACENEGISYAVSTASMLANTMASYYKVLAPMLTTCKVRWIEYTDVIGATTFQHNLCTTVLCSDQLALMITRCCLVDSRRRAVLAGCPVRRSGNHLDCRVPGIVQTRIPLDLLQRWPR